MDSENITIFRLKKQIFNSEAVNLKKIIACTILKMVLISKFSLQSMRIVFILCLLSVEK